MGQQCWRALFGGEDHGRNDGHQDYLTTADQSSRRSPDTQYATAVTPLCINGTEGGAPHDPAVRKHAASVATAGAPPVSAGNNTSAAPVRHPTAAHHGEAMGGMTRSRTAASVPPSAPAGTAAAQNGGGAAPSGAITGFFRNVFQLVGGSSRTAGEESGGGLGGKKKRGHAMAELPKLIPVCCLGQGSFGYVNLVVPLPSFWDDAGEPPHATAVVVQPPAALVKATGLPPPGGHNGGGGMSLSFAGIAPSDATSTTPSSEMAGTSSSSRRFMTAQLLTGVHSHTSHLHPRGHFGVWQLPGAHQHPHALVLKGIKKNKQGDFGDAVDISAERFLAARLRHPFVIRIYAAFQSDRTLFVVLPFASGGDLGMFLTRQLLSAQGRSFRRLALEQWYATPVELPRSLLERPPPEAEANATKKVPRWYRVEAVPQSCPCRCLTRSAAVCRSGAPPSPTSASLLKPPRGNTNLNAASTSSSRPNGNTTASHSLCEESQSWRPLSNASSMHSLLKRSTSDLASSNTARNLATGDALSPALSPRPQSLPSVLQHPRRHVCHCSLWSGEAGGLPLLFVAFAAFELTSALQYLSQELVVHADLRPANIFLAGDGHIWLGDFSTMREANIDGFDSVNQGTGYVSGGPAGGASGGGVARNGTYLPPEEQNIGGGAGSKPVVAEVPATHKSARQAAASPTPSSATPSGALPAAAIQDSALDPDCFGASGRPVLDTWSLGVTLIELASGIHPFERSDLTIMQRFQAIKKGTFQTLSPMKFDVFDDPELYDDATEADTDISTTEADMATVRRNMNTAVALFNDLIAQCLQADSKKRLTAIGLRCHPFFGFPFVLAHMGVNYAAVVNETFGSEAAVEAVLAHAAANDDTASNSMPGSFSSAPDAAAVQFKLPADAAMKASKADAAASSTGMTSRSLNADWAKLWRYSPALRAKVWQLVASKRLVPFIIPNSDDEWLALSHGLPKSVDTPEPATADDSDTQECFHSFVTVPTETSGLLAAPGSVDGRSPWASPTGVHVSLRYFCTQPDLFHDGWNASANDHFLHGRVCAGPTGWRVFHDQLQQRYERRLRRAVQMKGRERTLSALNGDGDPQSTDDNVQHATATNFLTSPHFEDDSEFLSPRSQRTKGDARSRAGEDPEHGENLNMVSAFSHSTNDSNDLAADLNEEEPAAGSTAGRTAAADGRGTGARRAGAAACGASDPRGGSAARGTGRPRNMSMTATGSQQYYNAFTFRNLDHTMFDPGQALRASAASDNRADSDEDTAEA